MYRFEITTGINGNTTDFATVEVVRVAKLLGAAVTVTTGTGYCAPWDDEPVLVITTYTDDRLIVKILATTLCEMFDQDAVAVAEQDVTFNLVSRRDES